MVRGEEGRVTMGKFEYVAKLRGWRWRGSGDEVKTEVG